MARFDAFEKCLSIRRCACVKRALDSMTKYMVKEMKKDSFCDKMVRSIECANHQDVGQDEPRLGVDDIPTSKLVDQLMHETLAGEAGEFFFLSTLSIKLLLYCVGKKNQILP